MGKTRREKQAGLSINKLTRVTFLVGASRTIFTAEASNRSAKGIAARSNDNPRKPEGKERGGKRKPPGILTVAGSGNQHGTGDVI